MSFLEAVSLTTKPMNARDRSSPPRQSAGHVGICLGGQSPMMEDNIGSSVVQVSSIHYLQPVLLSTPTIPLPRDFSSLGFYHLCEEI